MTAQTSVVSPNRYGTAIGTFGGALAEVPATRLGSIAISAAVTRAGLRTDDIETVSWAIRAGWQQNESGGRLPFTPTTGDDSGADCQSEFVDPALRQSFRQRRIQLGIFMSRSRRNGEHGPGSVLAMRARWDKGWGTGNFTTVSFAMV